MLNQHSISVLVIARNEEATINHVITKCINVLPKVTKDFEILVNDDASADKTTSILNSLSKKYFFIKVFHQNQPLGIAGGLEFLYKKAKKHLVFTLSGDGQYTINDLPSMIEQIESGSDLVVGKRIHKNYDLLRELISFLFNFLPKIIFGVNLYDAGSIKLYKKEVLQKTTPLSKSVFNEAERIIRAYKLGYKVTYAPIQHLLRRKGMTSIKSCIVYASFLDMLKLFFLYQINSVIYSKQIYALKKISQIFTAFLILLFLWMLIKTAFPIKIAGLSQKYDICDIGNIGSWQEIQSKDNYITSKKFLSQEKNDYIEFFHPKQPERPLFICRKIIPVLEVYRANTMTAKVKLNQPGEFNIGLVTKGVGPFWTGIIKPEDVNKEITFKWSLDREQSGNTLKLNWLPEDFSGSGIFIEKKDLTKDLIITIYQLYIE